MANMYLSTDERRVPVSYETRSFSVDSANRRKPVYTPIDGVDLVNFKTRGGTTSVVDGVLNVISTATVTAPYRPDVKPGDRVNCLVDSSEWDVLSVENVDMMCRIMILTLRQVEGAL